MHNYPGPGSPKPEANRAAVLGEFGALGLSVDGHTWSNRPGATEARKAPTNLDPQLRKIALRKAWELQGQPRPLRLHLHANHRRGDRDATGC